MSDLQLVIHLITATVPALGVLAFLLLHRRQHIDADLQELRMRQEHGQTLNLLAARKHEALSAAAQAYAPMIAQLGQQLLASNSPTLEDFETGELVEELDRRVVRHFSAANGQHAASCHDLADEGVPHPIDPDKPVIN